LYPEHARSLVGLGAAFAMAGQRAKSAAALERATIAIQGLRRGGRGSEATLAEAFHHAVSGHEERALHSIEELLGHPGMPFAGWTLPIEPLFTPLRPLPRFQSALRTLAERAR